MGRRSRWLALLVVGGPSLALACSSFEADVRPSDAGIPDSTVDDRGTSDASDASDAQVIENDGSTSQLDAAADATLFFESFEDGFDCSGWKTTTASAIREDGGRTGSSSCRLCPLGSSTAILARTTTGVGPGIYQLEAWTRQVAGDSGTANVHIIMNRADGGTETQPQSSKVGQTAEWQRSSVSPNVTDGTGTITLRVVFEGSAGNCIAIDDIALLYQAQ